MKNTSTASIIALGFLALGCTDAGTSMIIVQNQVPGDGCVISDSLGSNFPSGIIDVAADRGYIFNPLVENLAAVPAATANGTRQIEIQGYEVDIEFVDDALNSTDFGALTSFSRRLSGRIFPGGRAGLSMEVVPKELLDSLNVGAGDSIDLVAEVKVYGSMDGGDVETSGYAYPVEVCNGCLVVDNGLCTELASGFVARTGGECNTLQDEVLDCCTKSDNSLLCPAQKEEIVMQ